MTPSPFQEAIYAHRLLPRLTHAMVRARAGCGKTYAIVEFCKRLRKSENALYLPFNVSIAREGEEKLQQCRNVEVRTLNAFGNRLIWKNRDKVTTLDLELSSDKNEIFFRELIGETDWNKYGKYIVGKFSRAVSLLKEQIFDLSYDPTDLLFEYDLIPEDKLAAQCDIVQVITQHWDKLTSVLAHKGVALYDYADQLYIPYKLKLRAPIYTYVIVDEAQDLSPIQWMLIFTMARYSTIIFVGDPMQCIYEFRGASFHSMNYAAEQLKAVIYDLPVCYRCGTEIIKQAQLIVEDIVSPEGMHEGQVTKIPERIFYQNVVVSDAVLARTNRELVDIAHELRFDYGKRVYIRGDKAIRAILDVARRAKLSRLDDSLTCVSKLESWELNKIAGKADPRLPQSLQEPFDALITACSRLDDYGQVVDFLTEIFPEEPGRDSIELSTIHRFKGREADHVYYINPRLYNEDPSEDRIAYVAITRARRTLTYVTIPRRKERGTEY